MRTRSLVAGLGLMTTMLFLNGPVHSEVMVQFVEPQLYTDANPQGYGADDATLLALEAKFQTLAGRCLRAGESLEIRVLNVDLAGQQEWWQRGAIGVRVMRDITWPRLNLDYVWRDAGGKVLGEARGEAVHDMNYLLNSAYVRSNREPLPYETAMLREWTQRRFCRDHS